MRELAGKTAFVTGGASGIGLALGRAFAEAGMKVMLADIEAAPLAAAVPQLKDLGPDVCGITCDVADPASVEHAAKASFERFGNVHILCNNAGVAAAGGIEEISLENWRWVLDVNLMGVVHGIHTFLPHIRAHGEGGHIVNTASMAGMNSGLGFSPYSASKFAVVNISEGLAARLKPLGIGVTVLCPGFVRTRINESGRNRPKRCGPARIPDPASPAGLLRARIAELTRSGLDPSDVAAQVISAISSPTPARSAARPRLGSRSGWRSGCADRGCSSRPLGRMILRRWPKPKPGSLCPTPLPKSPLKRMPPGTQILWWCTTRTSPTGAPSACNERYASERSRIVQEWPLSAHPPRWRSPSEGPLTEPTADAPPRRRELFFVPRSGHCPLAVVQAHCDHITRIVVAIRVEGDICVGMDIDIAARRLAELGNPTRLQIVRLLVQAGRDGLAIGELQARLGVPASTLAFHLRGLVTADIVEQEKQGRSVRCTIDSRAINATLAFVKENCCAGFSTAEPVQSRRIRATR